jgi:hypothetical protein
MTQVQTYDEFMNEIKGIELIQHYNNSRHCQKMRKGNISTMTNKLTAGNNRDIIGNEGIDIVNKMERDRTNGDNPTKLRLQQKLKKQNASLKN